MPRTMKSSMPRAIYSTPEKYLSLLFNPCSGDLVHPPYMGTESGYLVRTRDIIVPYYNLATTPSAPLSGLYTSDFGLQWSPGNLGPAAVNTNFGLFSGGAGAGSSSVSLVAGTQAFNVVSGAQTAQSNFVNQTALTSFRVVACCVEWVPTGPSLYRQGLVSLVSANSPQISAFGQASLLMSNIESSCPHVVRQGAEKHEIVWLPGSKDQEYGALEASVVESGYGTILAALASVDSTITPYGTGTACCITPNGRFEITTVWQWNSKLSGGLTFTNEAPSPHTLNTVLSKVKNIGHKVYTGAKMGIAIAEKLEHLLL